MKSILACALVAVVSLLTACSADPSTADQPSQSAPATSDTTASAAPNASCPVPSKNYTWDSVLCSDGSPNPAVREDLKVTSPTVMGLSGDSSWDTVLKAMCLDRTNGTNSYQLAQAYEYKRAEYRWTSYRKPVEIPELLENEHACGSPQMRAKTPRHDCPAPKVMQNGSFDDVLCDDGSPNAKVRDSLLRSTPRIMALGLTNTPSMADLADAVCDDLANSTNMIVRGAYEWKRAEQGWDHLPEPNGLLDMIVREGLCEKDGDGLPAGQEVSLSKVSITVHRWGTFSIASRAGYFTAAIAVTVCAKDPVTVGSVPWTVVDNSGTSHTPVANPNIGGFTPFPSGTSLQPGECARGDFAFELPLGSDAVQVRYSTTHGDNAVWNLR